MKRIIAVFLVLVMLFGMCACGNTKAPTDSAAETSENQTFAEEFPAADFDNKPVDIYRAVLDFEGVGAEAYVANLKAENPEKEYRYYNEDYYIETITEAERKATLEEMKNVDTFFAGAFAEEYPGLFIKAELNKNLDELTLHFNREAYESNMFVGFAVLVVGAAYMDTLAAYNLVAPEDRAPHFVCVDENGEILLDSDALGEAE